MNIWKFKEETKKKGYKMFVYPTIIGYLIMFAIAGILIFITFELCSWLKLVVV